MRLAVLWLCDGCVEYRVRSSVPRMKQSHSASSPATSIPTTIRWRRIARTFLPELKDLFVQARLAGAGGGRVETGDDQPGWNQGACRCLPAPRSQLQATPGVGGAAASRDRGAISPERTERPARGPRWATGGRGDSTARGPPGAAGAG